MDRTLNHIVDPNQVTMKIEHGFLIIEEWSELEECKDQTATYGTDAAENCRTLV